MNSTLSLGVFSVLGGYFLSIIRESAVTFFEQTNPIPNPENHDNSFISMN